LPREEQVRGQRERGKAIGKIRRKYLRSRPPIARKGEVGAYAGKRADSEPSSGEKSTRPKEKEDDHLGTREKRKIENGGKKELRVKFRRERKSPARKEDHLDMGGGGEKKRGRE